MTSQEISRLRVTAFIYLYNSEFSCTYPQVSFWLSIALLNSQLCLRTAFDPGPTFIVVQSWHHPLLNELFHLLRRSAHETLRVKEVEKVFLYRVEVWVSLDPLDEIVLQTELFDLMSRLVRQDLSVKSAPSVSCYSTQGESYPDLFMRHLPIPSLFYDRHDDVLGSHERQLLKDMPFDHLRVHYQPLRHILQRLQYHISRQKRFRESDSSIRPVNPLSKK